MAFQFESVGELLAMAGHGPYVWACYAITVAVLILLVVSPVRKKARFLREQRRLQQLNQRKAGASAKLDESNTGEVG